MIRETASFMKFSRFLRSRSLRSLLWAVSVLALGVGANAQDNTVQLPPMMVQETEKMPPWRYAKIPEMEVLSRCSDGTTKDFLRSYLHMRHVLRALIPDQYLLHQELPRISILVAQDSKQLVSREVIADMQKKEKQKPRQRRYGGYLPNMSLLDSELSVTFAMLDERNGYERNSLSMTVEQLKLQMQARTPPLPLWFIEGMTEFYKTGKQDSEAMVFGESHWINDAETKAIQEDSEFPRALLPMKDLLERESMTPPAGSQGGEYVRTWRSQAALFVRWALTSRLEARRAAFWKYVNYLDRYPPSEQLFERCFGLGYSDVQERLSDFLSNAVEQSSVIRVTFKEAKVDITLRNATQVEVSRLRGEWERQEIAYVEKHHPEWVKTYIDQARHTLRRAYELGSEDPQLMAAIGLFEAEVKNPDAAFWFLNAAAKAGVPRPRVYLELAKVRYKEWSEVQGQETAGAGLPPPQVIELFEKAKRYAPPLAPVQSVLAQLRVRDAANVTEAQLAEIEQAARLFPRLSNLVSIAVVLHAQHNKGNIATALFLQGYRFAQSAEDRAKLEQVRDAVWGKPPPPKKT